MKLDGGIERRLQARLAWGGVVPRREHSAANVVGIESFGVSNRSRSDASSFVRCARFAVVLVAGGCGGLTESVPDACVYTEPPPDAADAPPPVDAAPGDEDVGPTVDAALTCAKTGTNAYVAQLALGAGRTCALMSDGTVKCWGAAPLGDGTSSNRSVPIQVPCLSNIVDITAGTGHVCVVRNDGAVLCWGKNQFEQIVGIGSVGLDVLAPKVVVGVTGVVEVAAGGNHTCARRADGTMACWGDDLNGALGADYDPSMVPPDVPITDVMKVVAGAQHTCVLIKAGTVTCWGDDSHHQRGDSPYTYGHTQSTTAGVSGVLDLTAHHGDHTCAIVSGDTVCWGFDEDGQIGDGTIAYTKPPTSVIGGAGITQISAGAISTCGVWSDGSVRCWGSGNYGILGDGSTPHAAPAPVPNLAGAIRVEVGWSHACAILADHSVWCWGDNSSGELGDGTTISRSTPAVVTF